MISYKKLFKSYNLKTWKLGKLQIFLSIFAISIAVAILVSLQLVISLNASYESINARNINGGDINISLSNSKLTKEQQNSLENLKSKNYFNFTTSYKLQNNLSVGDITGLVYLKFVDSKNYSIYERKLQENLVLINKTVADRFNLKKGDKVHIYIKGTSEETKEFEIGEVIENSGAIDEDVLGAVLINKSNLGESSDLVSNINIVIKADKKIGDVKELLAKDFMQSGTIKTTEDLISQNRETLKTESTALKLIEILVIVITGAGISITTLLLTLKRKKDYVLLTVYGMPQRLLSNLILYETFIISVIGNIIGVVLSFLIIEIIEQPIIKHMDLFTLIASSLMPIITTVIFIIAQTLIFTLLPIEISKKINPASILRQQNKENALDKENSYIMFKMFVLIALCFSLYIHSITNGLKYICIIFVFTVIFYGLVFEIINLITRIKIRRSKVLLLANRNLSRQSDKFALCATALVLTLILSGIIINISYNIIPEIMDQYVDKSGYNLTLNTDYKEAKKVEEVLKSEKYVEDFTKTINTTAVLKNANGKSVESILKERPRLFDGFDKFELQAVDLNKDMIKPSIASGRWFKTEDKNKNYIVLSGEYDHLGIYQDDVIELEIQGKTIKFQVIGMLKEDHVRDAKSCYIDLGSVAVITGFDENNSKLNYLIKCDNKNEKILTSNLSKKLKNVLIINERTLFSEGL